LEDKKKSRKEGDKTPDEDIKEEKGEEVQPTPEEKTEEVKEVTEEKPEEPEEEKEETAEAEEPIEEKKIEEISEVKDETTEPKEEPATPEEKPKKPVDVVDEKIEEKVSEEKISPEKPIEEKQPVEEKPKEAPKEKDDKKDDFKYIARIANTDVDGEKKVVLGLSQIKGLGWHMAALVADTAGINREIKIGDLSDAQIEKIKEVLANLNTIAPGWMLNHRKDYDTGKNIHLISSDVDMRLRDDINVLKMIRSYRGIRHESGLPVRGQRTRANSRRGLAMGVSRKRIIQQKK
jgi:small subunit ribosomal protein S13